MTSMQTMTNREKANFEVAKTVGLISDTHVPKRAIKVPQKVFEVLNDADFIIHAGDLVELSVIDELEEIAPVLAVHGNMDDQEASGALPELNSLKIFDWKIGVMHDPNDLQGSNKMVEIAKKNGFNVLVYGHTHASKITWEGKNLFVNPGSPTDPASFINKPSVGLLKITKQTISPQIINL
jgi:putative phosphoesterase